MDVQVPETLAPGWYYLSIAAAHSKVSVQSSWIEILPPSQDSSSSAAELAGGGGGGGGDVDSGGGGVIDVSSASISAGSGGGVVGAGAGGMLSSLYVYNTFLDTLFGNGVDGWKWRRCAGGL